MKTPPEVIAEFESSSAGSIESLLILEFADSAQKVLPISSTDPARLELVKEAMEAGGYPIAIVTARSNPSSKGISLRYQQPSGEPFDGALLEGLKRLILEAASAIGATATEEQP